MLTFNKKGNKYIEVIIMDYKKLMKKRKSIRVYKDEKVKNEELEKLVHYFHNCKRLISDIQLELIMLIEGKDVFNKLNGIAGYNGKMIEAPTYMVLTSQVREGYIENTGFIVENIMLKAEELGLNTCWISFPNSKTIKKNLFINCDKEVTAMIALGYGIEQKKILHVIETGDNYSKANMSVIQDNTSFRYAVEDFVYHKEWENSIDYETLEMRGLGDVFTYVKLTPSTLNSQPWKFILDDSKLVLTIKDSSNINERNELTDAGIIMLYVDLILSETIYNFKWQLGKPNKTYDIPDDYRIVAWCNM